MGAGHTPGRGDTRSGAGGTGHTESGPGTEHRGRVIPSQEEQKRKHVPTTDRAMARMTWVANAEGYSTAPAQGSNGGAGMRWYEAAEMHHFS